MLRVVLTVAKQILLGDMVIGFGTLSEQVRQQYGSRTAVLTGKSCLDVHMQRKHANRLISERPQSYFNRI